MAYIGIDGQPCPSCGSTATSEVSKPADYPKRDIYLTCLSCRNESFVGTYEPRNGKLERV